MEKSSSDELEPSDGAASEADAAGERRFGVFLTRFQRAVRQTNGKQSGCCDAYAGRQNHDVMSDEIQYRVTSWPSVGLIALANHRDVSMAVCIIPQVKE